MFVNFQFGLSSYNVYSGDFYKGFLKLETAVKSAVRDYIVQAFDDSTGDSGSGSSGVRDKQREFLLSHLDEYVESLADASVVWADWYCSSVSIPTIDFDGGALIIKDFSSEEDQNKESVYLDHQFFD